MVVNGSHRLGVVVLATLQHRIGVVDNGGGDEAVGRRVLHHFHGGLELGDGRLRRHEVVGAVEDEGGLGHAQAERQDARGDECYFYCFLPVAVDLIPPNGHQSE